MYNLMVTSPDYVTYIDVLSIYLILNILYTIITTIILYT